MSFFTAAKWQGGKKAPSRLPECGRCGLFKLCQSPKMKPSGRGKKKILFVAEAPGEKEDEKGTQLVGKTGQYLRQVLHKLHVELDDCYKTNSIICRPPDNKIEDLHIECCRPNLLNTIRNLKPTVIVLLGGSAVKSLLPLEREADVGSIGRWVGWTIPSHEHQAWICPTYHPSYLMRMNDRVLDLLFKQHLKKAISLEEKPISTESLESLKKKVEIVTSPREARLRLKDLAKKDGILAFDYEATGLKPDHPDHKIVSVSFCFEGEETWATLVDESMYPGLSRVLKSETLLKVASNLKHEERWTRAKLGHPVHKWFWDTMLAAHVLDNRQGICGLKFQAYVQFGIADYDTVVAQYFTSSDAKGFNRIHEIPIRDLLTYNGLDSLLEYKLMRVQRKAMGLS